MSDVFLPSARGGKKPSGPPLMVEVVRPLGPDDLELLANPPPLGSATPGIKELRHSHHVLAQAIARGDTALEASVKSGYSISRISILQDDPAFAELVTHYAAQQELAFAEVTERMKDLGISTLDELQRRLEDAPGGFTNRELMDMTEMLLVKSRQAMQVAAQTGVAGPLVNIKFVTSNMAGTGPVIDGEPG